MKTTVADVMSTDVETVNADEDLVLAEELMRRNRFRHLPVVRAGKLVGLMTHRDLLRAQAKLLTQLGLAADEDRALSLAVGDMMTKDVRTVAPDTPARDAAALLLDHKVGCFPVVRDEKLVGIVTEADFLRWAMRAFDREH